MRISATHSAVYRYDFPVYLEPHIFRLRPRMNSAQRLLAFDLQITPTSAGATECMDQDGNLALNAWFNAPTTELSVMSRFTVELLRENPPAVADGVADAGLSLARLDLTEEIQKVRVCAHCSQQWFVARNNFHFCSGNGCREASYAKDPKYLRRKALNQKAYRNRMKSSRAYS